MASVESTIEIEAPLEQVYKQWTLLEQFPRYMEGIEKVEQLSDTRVRFTGEIGGVERTWEAKIVEQVPNDRIQWRSTEGPDNGGTVLFEEIRPGTTKVTLFLDYEPESFTEKMGDAFGIFNARVKKDLQNFKEYMEERKRAEGGWEGEIHGGRRTN